MRRKPLMGKAKKKSKPKDEKSKGMKDWTEDEVATLIEILEENCCLWDTFHQDYSNRGSREIAYAEIATKLDTTVDSVKTKINGLRAQLAREQAKVNKTKSGQGTDELYESKWVHYKETGL